MIHKIKCSEESASAWYIHISISCRENTNEEKDDCGDSRRKI